MCIAGDEASVVVPGAAYALPFHTPGTGILTIETLGGDQLAEQGSASRLPVILRGSIFVARFQVIGKAVSGGVADPTPFYYGTGRFVTSNTRVRSG